MKSNGFLYFLHIVLLFLAQAQVNYRVVGAADEILGQGKELSQLKNKLSDLVENAFTEIVENSHGTEEITCWDFGDLPLSQEIDLHGDIITVYPSLIEEDGKVYRYAFDNINMAETYLKYGLRGLLKNELVQEIKYLRKNLRGIDKLALLYSSIGKKSELLDEIVGLVLDETFLYEKALIRQQDHFYATLHQDKQHLLINAEKTCVLLAKILEKYRTVVSELSELDQQKHVNAVEDIESQIEYLIFNGFINDVPFEYLLQYPRYFDAILKRIEKLEFAQDKDSKNILLIEEHWNRIKKLVDNAYETECFFNTLSEYRWMIEELRISLFTQELKTRFPISIKRMDKMLEKHIKSTVVN